MGCIGNCVGADFADPNTTNAICPTNAKQSQGGPSPGGLANTGSGFGSQIAWVMGAVGTKLNPPIASDRFGTSVAIGPNFFVIGSYADNKGVDAGKVEMFALDGTYIKTIYSNGPIANDYFGFSVAVNSNFILVGAAFNDINGIDSGKVEVFDINGTYLKTIYSNSPAAGNYFGKAIAINSSSVLIGSPGTEHAGTIPGKVEIFSIDGTYIKTLSSPTPNNGDLFGYSIAINQNFILIGSPMLNKVEMFSLDGTYIKTISSNQANSGNSFGVSVAIDSSYILIGSHGDDVKGLDTGKVEVFDINGIYIKTLYSNQPAPGDQFGKSIAINNTMILIGAHGDDDNGISAGKVEMFTLDGTYIKTIYSNQSASGTGTIIFDTDIIYQMIDKINVEIDRYNAYPRHDITGNIMPYLGGTKIQTMDTSVTPNVPISYDNTIILSSTWVNIVKKVMALEAARGIFSDLSTSPVDIKDGEDLVLYEFLVKLFNELNTITQDVSCGIACKCNIVCNCNGNCGCNY